MQVLHSSGDAAGLGDDSPMKDYPWRWTVQGTGPETERNRRSSHRQRVSPLIESLGAELRRDLFSNQKCRCSSFKRNWFARNENQLPAEVRCTQGEYVCWNLSLDLSFPRKSRNMRLIELILTRLFVVCLWAVEFGIWSYLSLKWVAYNIFVFEVIDWLRYHSVRVAVLLSFWMVTTFAL